MNGIFFYFKLNLSVMYIPNEDNNLFFFQCTYTNHTHVIFYSVRVNRKMYVYNYLFSILKNVPVT